MNQPKISPVEYYTTVPSEVESAPAANVNHPPFGETASTFFGVFVLLSSTLLLFCSMKRRKSLHAAEMVSPTFSPFESEAPLWTEDAAFKLPCPRCHYFNANRHLACAVHPVEVLTPEAKNCQDFRHRATHPRA